MTNIKVIRQDREKITLLDVIRRIIGDSRLTPSSKLFIIEVLSNDDTKFTFSPTNICNRCSLSLASWDKNIKMNLVESGYLMITKISEDKSIAKIKKKGSKKNVNFYTFSEYGNLTQKQINPEPKETVTEIQEVITDDSTLSESNIIEAPTEEQLDNFKKWYLEQTEGTQEIINNLIANEYPNFNTNITEFKKFRAECKNINKETNKTVNEVINEICDVKLDQSNFTILEKKSIRAELLSFYNGTTFNNISEDELRIAIEKTIRNKRINKASQKRANLDQKYLN